MNDGQTLKTNSGEEVVIRSCGSGHRFAVLVGSHPMLADYYRCPHCLAIAIGAAQTKVEVMRRELTKMDTNLSLSYIKEDSFSRG